jgi:hypothetical protein
VAHFVRPSRFPPQAHVALFSRRTSNRWGYWSTPLGYREAFEPRIVSTEKDIDTAFKKASELLVGPEGHLSDRLLGAIKWAGKASATEKREDSFIFYAIALESLLLGQHHHDQLTYKLRLRAAHLLGLKASARARIRDRVKRLYDLRSTIVHSGRTKVPRADLDELRIFAQSCIIRLLSDHTFTKCLTDDQLEDWFEDKVLCGPEGA